MLTLHTLQRLFEHGRYEPMLDALMANGLTLPLPLRVRLSQSPTASVGLGLRRLVELTYGSTGLSRRMVDWLLRRQDEDGSWDDDVLATAVAAAALARVACDHPPDAATPAGVAVERALAWLAARQDDDGLFADPADRDRQQRLLVTIFVIYLLAECPLFRGAVRFADALGAIEQALDRLPAAANELWELTYATHLTSAGPATGHRVRPSEAGSDRSAAGANRAARELAAIAG